MKALWQWLEERTGAGEATVKCSAQAMPGRACGCKVWPAAILFAFCVEAITGFVLWMFYSPSAETAWESVYYIQNEVAGGWLLRAMHHYGAQVLLALLIVYVLQTILTASYRAPRELVFWTAVGMGLCALAAILTGDLLSWDQNGYASTKTRTGFLMLIPWIGEGLLKLAIGGPPPALGSHTLTRFFGLHVGKFGGAFVLLLLLHYVFSRRADAVQLAKSGGQGAPLWGRQAWYNAAACLIVMAVILGLSCQHGVSGPGAGAFLGSPADPDPAHAYAAARPEWFLTGVYEFSHWFAGQWLVLPIFVIPAAVLCLVLAMPFIGRGPKGQIFNAAFTGVVLTGLIVLTYVSWSKDAADQEHQQAIAEERERAARARELADFEGIPAAGALAMLQNDPLSEGPRVFERSCASCHRHIAENGRSFDTETPSAPDLGNFASRAWIAGFMDPVKIESEEYLGNTRFAAGAMVRYVQDRFVKLKPEERKAVVEALAAEAQLAPPENPQIVEKGRQIIAGRECARCHQFHGKGPAGVAPDLTGYGSRDWIVGMIADPTNAAFYGVRNDRMEAYLTSLARPADNLLMPRAVNTVTGWLRNDWYKPEEKEELLKLQGEKPPALPPSVEILVDRWQRGRLAVPAVKVKEADLSARQLFQVELCTVCHDYTVGGDKSIEAADPSAPDLGKFASRQWLAGLLDPKQIVTRKYFGSNPAFRAGKMVGHVRETFVDLDEEQKQEVAAIVAALSAEADLPSQREPDKKDAKQIEQGRKLLADDTYGCLQCHTFSGKGAKTGPLLTGYGSKAWLTGIIANPQAEAYYPKNNDGMPSYHMFPKQPARNLLTPEQVEAIAEMIRRQQ